MKFAMSLWDIEHTNILDSDWLSDVIMPCSKIFMSHARFRF
jgi:hypothetical protein